MISCVIRISSRSRVVKKIKTSEIDVDAKKTLLYNPKTHA